MQPDQLRQLIRQPEGLKLDFKREFYHIDLPDVKARERQWGELAKDVLSLANGNVNIVGESGYLIFGVGDQITADGTREIFDVGLIKITGQQILDKVNSLCHPPLSDLGTELLLLDGQRVLVLTVPPSPHLHETTKRLETSNGRTYPEYTVFIRRGEGVHTASMPEAQAILAEKQRLRGKPKPQITRQTTYKSFIDKQFIVFALVFAFSFGIWGYFTPGKTPLVPSIIFGLLIGSVGGMLFSIVIKVLQWLISKRPNTKTFLSITLWLPIACFAVVGISFSKNIGDLPLSVIVGATFGLMVSSIFVPIVWIVDWIVSQLRRFI